MFSQATIEQLKFYVYAYRDPRDGKIFYVGKGKDNRCFSHMNDADESEKVAKINQIREFGEMPKIEIIRHGIPDELIAYQIEQAIIDAIGCNNLCNQVRGHGAIGFGNVSADEIEAIYGAQEKNVDVPAILVRINKNYREDMTQNELYEITRGVWKVGPRRTSAKFAFAVYRGIVREVYRIKSWHKAYTTEYKTRNFPDRKHPERWEFLGEPADAEIRTRYINARVKFPENAQNPIQYENC